MYKIALVCENGASTGMVVRTMIAAAKSKEIEAEIAAYPFTQLENFIDEKDVILIGPQLAFKKDAAIKSFPQHAGKISTIAPMDFGMMNGAKILEDAIKIADNNK